MPRTEAARDLLKKTSAVFRSRWIYLALMVPVVLLAIAAAMLIWPINYAEGPYRADPYRKYATPSALPSLLDDPSLAGKSVYLNEVQLVPASKENAYIAHGAAGNTMLVLATAQASKLPKEAAVANVQGVIRPLPSKTTLKKEWKLNAKQLAAISNDHYYLAAQQIRIQTRRSTRD
ncbi:MAG: hypothetical protein ACRD3E_04490 [Terriglobales bacterium]